MRCRTEGCKVDLDSEEDDTARRQGGGFCGRCLDAQDAEQQEQWESSQREWPSTPPRAIKGGKG